MTFATERDADLRAENVVSGAAGSRFTCMAGADTSRSGPAARALQRLQRAGRARRRAFAGRPLETAAAALAGAGRVPGRFEPVDEGQEFSVVVDYAHTPDSLANVLRASRELLESASNGTRPGRLLCVFGAGGDRDREKRPLMGEAARKLADHVIVTSDNPRSEDPDAIIAAIVEGAERAAGGEPEPSTLEVEPDRRAAIARALSAAGAGDLVMIAGKGHEQGQELAGGVKIPFDDRDVARQELHAASESAGRSR